MGAVRDQHANTDFELQRIWQLNFSYRKYLISFIKQSTDWHVHIGLLHRYMSDQSTLLEDCTCRAYVS
jgi:hypothetical protein